ncbi:FkbM family methyltransferase [Flavobacterium covae]|uniref:FkbM family methyltransferase n=1 Tax=Flavobacterium covae TaxID=2906076 RepID=UPI001FB6363E|nr:FkbM family methyltransferase [Flavobacterium covae]MCJ1805681.1 FkbM family methyltransferase [Flavobacterium covae]
MIKLRSLYRINFKNRIVLFFYYVLKIFGFKPTQKQILIHELYHHLIVSNGILVFEDPEKYKVRLFDSKIELYIRKFPSSDVKVFGQIFRGNEYKKVVELYCTFFGTNPEYIIDAGGNVGYTSVYFKSIFPKVNLAIIEPSSTNFCMIQNNFLQNNIDAHLFKGGLWNKNTSLKIVHDFRDQSDWAIRVEESEIQSDLKAFTVDFILEDTNFKNIDILKIDIEGSEKQIFSKNGSIDFLKKTKCIAIEIHDEFDCREDIMTLLANYGFELTNYGELTIGINQNLIFD